MTTPQSRSLRERLLESAEAIRWSPTTPQIYANLMAEAAAALSETGAIVIEEGFTYWTHEGHIMRRHYTGSPHDSIEALGPGGWTEVP